MLTWIGLGSGFLFYNGILRRINSIHLLLFLSFPCSSSDIGGMKGGPGPGSPNLYPPYGGGGGGRSQSNLNI